MTRNPFLNALAAIAYIAVVGLLPFVAPIVAPRVEGSQFVILVPIAVIALFTLSAAVMGYVFLYQPFQLYMEGNKTQAVSLFLKTVAVFAGITVLIFVAVFLGALVT